MDFAAFKVALEASRSFEASVNGAKFQMRMPTEHAWRMAHETHRGVNGDLLLSAAMREILNAAVVGWEGVTGKDFLADGTQEPLPFTPAARSILLDNRQDIADLLSIEVTRRVLARQKERDEAAKN